MHISGYGLYGVSKLNFEPRSNLLFLFEEMFMHKQVWISYTYEWEILFSKAYEILVY